MILPSNNKVSSLKIPVDYTTTSLLLVSGKFRLAAQSMLNDIQPKRVKPAQTIKPSELDVRNSDF